MEITGERGSYQSVAILGAGNTKLWKATSPADRPRGLRHRHRETDLHHEDRCQ